MSDTIGRLRECLKAAGKRGAVAITTNELWHLVDALEAEQRTSESEHRMELWLGHGHIGLYGDDGEMQCSLCRADYKRDPLPELERKASEAAQVAAAKAAMYHLRKRAHELGVMTLWLDIDENLDAEVAAFVASRRAASAEDGS